MAEEIIATPGQILHFPDIEERKKAVLHAEATSIRAGLYAEAETIALGQAAIILCKADGWMRTHDGQGRMYLKWTSDRPISATGIILDFKEESATTVNVKILGGVSGFIVTKQLLTAPGEEIRHHVDTDRLLWRQAAGLGETSSINTQNNPFAGWLDVALTVKALEELTAKQLLLPAPGDDVA